MRSFLFSIALLLGVAVPAMAQQSGFPLGTTTSDDSGAIRSVNGSVRYINKVDVPARADGSLVELKFEEGDTVNTDDVMAVIDDEAARLGVKLKQAEEKEAILTASNTVNLRDAKNSAEVAAAEYESFKELRLEGAIPYWEMEKKRLEAERQRLRIELAEMEKKVSEVKMIAKRSELEMAEYELTKRLVTAPYTGFIEKRIAQHGQWVQPGSPIATLIQMDRLRVEGDIEALRYPGRVHKGAAVEVTVDAGDHQVKVDGVIGFVSMEVDVNGFNSIWVEIQNENFGNDWKFKPGMRAEIVIK